ncbi:hypothetical protein MBLNU457_3312t1 [Dothideomycetes sp. NU457]
MATLLKQLTSTFPLPSASELEAIHFESPSPFPELNSFTSYDRPTMSLTYLKNLFSKPEPLHEKLPVSEPRRSTDVESLASTDASTLLDEERSSDEQPKKRKAAVDARVISDAIIGLSDGLTVPFALTAGLSALGDTRVVIFGGVAELIAGAISMGLGGYLGAKSEEESYKATLSSTRTQVSTTPSAATSSIAEILSPFDLPQHLTDDLTFHLSKSPHLVPFLMHFQHNLPEPESSRAITCALTIACGYFLGGFIPLVPYFLVPRTEVVLALEWSLGVMALALFVFGYGKTCFVTGFRGRANVCAGVKGGVQMMVVGGLAAGIAMAVIRLFSVWSSGS